VGGVTVNGDTVSPFTEDAPTKQGRPKNDRTVRSFTEDAAAKTGAGPGIAANLGLYGLTWGFRAVALVLTPPVSGGRHNRPLPSSELPPRQPGADASFPDASFRQPHNPEPSPAGTREPVTK